LTAVFNFIRTGRKKKMDAAEHSSKYIIDHLPRAVGLYPKVIRLLFHKNQYPLPAKRKITDIQICIQFSESVPLHLRIGGKDYSADCPRLYIKRPGEIHEILSDTDTTICSFCFVYDADSGIDRFIPEDLVLRPLKITSRIESLMSCALDLASRIGDFGDCDRIDETCAGILQEILLSCSGMFEPVDPYEKRIRNAVSWIHLHMQNQIDWNLLAAQFGFSERSFVRHWRNCMGESPHRYLVALRMAEARRLLAETSLRLEEIAKKVGYSSLESFGFAFRKRFEISPRSFRQQLNGDKSKTSLSSQK